MGDAPGVVRDVPFERVELDDHSWVDVARGFVRGADELYEVLSTMVPWQQGRVFRYERYLDEPRLGCWYPRDTPFPHPALVEAHRAIQARYHVFFDGVGLAWYRDGSDSVAFHRDSDMRYCENTVIAIVSLGATRPWLLQPRGNHDRFREGYGGQAIDLSPGGGDLLVMGGRCQASWLHAVPKVRALGRRGGRISAQWRWTSRTGRPETQPSYHKPRTFSRPTR